MGSSHDAAVGKVDAARPATTPAPSPAVPMAPIPLPAGPQTLVVGHADDHAEHDADRRADSALARLSRAGADAPSPPETHQHDPSCGHLRRSESAGSTASGSIGYAGGALSSDTDSRISRLRGGGSSLPTPVLRRMESAFGTSFSAVRIHTGSEAAGLSRDVSARAFTTGRDVFFGAGEYRPDTADGERTLAHELAHTLQPDQGLHRLLPKVGNFFRNAKDSMFNSLRIGTEAEQNKRSEDIANRNHADAKSDAAKARGEAVLPAKQKVIITESKVAEAQQRAAMLDKREKGESARAGVRDEIHGPPRAAVEREPVSTENITGVLHSRVKEGGPAGQVADLNHLNAQAMAAKQARALELQDGKTTRFKSELQAGREVFAMDKFKPLESFNPGQTKSEQLRLSILSAGRAQHEKPTEPRPSGRLEAGPDLAPRRYGPATQAEHEGVQSPRELLSQANHQREEQALDATMFLDGVGRGKMSHGALNQPDVQDAIRAKQKQDARDKASYDGVEYVKPKKEGALEGTAKVMGLVDLAHPVIGGAAAAGGALKEKKNTETDTGDPTKILKGGLTMVGSLTDLVNDTYKLYNAIDKLPEDKRTAAYVRCGMTSLQRMAELVAAVTNYIDSHGGPGALIPGWGAVVAGLKLANTMQAVYHAQNDASTAQQALDEVRTRQYVAAGGKALDATDLDVLLNPMRFAVAATERTRDLAAAAAASQVAKLGAAIASAVTLGAGTVANAPIALGDAVVKLADMFRTELNTKDARKAEGEANLGREGGSEALFLKDPRMAAAAMVYLARHDADTTARNFLVAMGVAAGDIDDHAKPFYDLINQLLTKLNQTPDKLLLKEEASLAWRNAKRTGAKFAKWSGFDSAVESLTKKATEFNTYAEKKGQQVGRFLDDASDAVVSGAEATGKWVASGATSVGKSVASGLSSAGLAVGGAAVGAATWAGDGFNPTAFHMAKAAQAGVDWRTNPLGRDQAPMPAAVPEGKPTRPVPALPGRRSHLFPGPPPGAARPAPAAAPAVAVKPELAAAVESLLSEDDKKKKSNA